MKENTTKPNVEPSSDQCEHEESTNNEEADPTELELETLNTQLDQLNSALDKLEQKNDDIQEQLKILLQSNRATRQQFQSAEAEKHPDSN